MTSDAKIGLLLALVFIFVIAFIVNGIPRFNNDTPSNDLTRNILDLPDTPPIGQNENRILDNSTRWESPIPDNLQSFNNNAGQGGLRGVQSEGRRVEVIGGGGQVKQQQDQAEQQTAKKETPDNNNNIGEVDKPAAQTPKIYTVVENDMLATIAKKVYGEVEGNRTVNVERIYAANGDVLRSPDEVYPGQKLVIPPLPGSASVLESNPLLEQADTIGARHLSAQQTTTISANTYLVGPDDSLWKIAAEKLGNGNRYMEIYELNKDILPDEHTVREGMRLRLPSN